MRTPIFNISPATRLWRAFFFLLPSLLLPMLVGPSLQAQAGGKRYRPVPDYVQLGKPDQEEGRRLLEELRGMGIPGDYYLEFQLRYQPRRADERVCVGRLWGGRRESGALTRLELRDAQTGEETRLLILTGPQPAIWRWTAAGGQTTKLPDSELFTPLGETLLTPFDLQMPYLFWTDFEYEGVAKVRGRPGYRFLLYPPASIALAKPELSGVRVSMDTQYKALVESQQIDTEGRNLKLVSLVELKSVGGQWIVRAVDVRDERSRDKTRLDFTAAALRMDFSDVLFEPGSLGDAVAAPQSERIERF